MPAQVNTLHTDGHTPLIYCALFMWSIKHSCWCRTSAPAGPVLAREVWRPEHSCRLPLLPDPYEAARVKVATSGQPGGGEGLYAVQVPTTVLASAKRSAEQ